MKLLMSKLDIEKFLKKEFPQVSKKFEIINFRISLNFQTLKLERKKFEEILESVKFKSETFENCETLKSSKNETEK